MKIAILGYGKEGQSAESYFQNKHHDIKVFDNFTPEEIAQQNLSNFDLVLRSPSLHPQAGWSSMTQYFFAHCPCPIIGVTGTKGKGTTCSVITALLKALGQKPWLVGNIGNPALDVLDQIQPNDVVVYEISSFQLWDLAKSPHIAVVLGIEPDHLNVHKDYADYVAAKANITKHQTSQDFCIYNQTNPDATHIASLSAGTEMPYPTTNDRQLDSLLDNLSLPGQHNRENAEAALRAVAAYLDQNFDHFLNQYAALIAKTFSELQGLPHRLQFLRELNGVQYYDDNFCTNVASLEVALKAFPDSQIVLIAGGRDKTANADLPEIINLIKQYATYTVLIGESGHKIAEILDQDSQITTNHFGLAKNLVAAVETARNSAEQLAQHAQPVILLMSPAAASFDMFKNVYDRGAQFQKIVKEL